MDSSFNVLGEANQHPGGRFVPEPAGGTRNLYSVKIGDICFVALGLRKERLDRRSLNVLGILLDG
jgi:hypothetical protein